MLELRLLGQFEVRVDGTPVVLPSRPAQSLLAYLALTAGTAHRRERLAALLWPDAEDANARSYLRQALWRIRKVIEAGLSDDAQSYLLADDLTVALNPRSSYWLDADVLERLSTDGSATADTLAAGLAVYRGELLPGFFDEWAVRERERLEAVFERQMDRLVGTLVEARRWPDVLEWGERWIALGHAPEPAYRALMLAHSERGDRAQMAAVYRRCREALFEELGAQPSDQTRMLYERLARGEVVLPPAAGEIRAPQDRAAEAPPAPGDPPFQGLRYFDTEDADRFFGREQLVARLVDRLRTERFLAVIGASGSGKSSVVRAGLVGVLRNRQVPTDGPQPANAPTDWSAHVLTPTAHPLEVLTTHVADAATSAAGLLESLGRDPRSLRLHLRRRSSRHGRTLLVVDQFEELFTLCRDPFEREAFIDNVLTAADQTDAPASVVVALRADFYAHCAQYPELRTALAEHQEYLGSMTLDELRRAIEEPARRGGWELEPGMVDLLLRDVGEEPGALPLLSHALLETWRRRTGRTLTLRGYAAAGGIRGAIAQTAETVFREGLAAEQQPIARRIFLRLTEPGEGTQDTRRRATVDELVGRPEEAPAMRAVLGVLAEARLVTLGAGTAEVAHEALIREWPTLRAWLDEDRAGLRLHRQLGDAARQWEYLGRGPDALYRGVRLAQAREWAEQHPAELNQLERAFLEASTELAEREAAEREAQRRRELDLARQRAEEQRRAAAQLRRRAVYLAAALVLAMGMAGLALAFGDQARQSAASAQASARIAFARELAAAAVSNLEVDPERSILLALQAVSTSAGDGQPPLREAEEALHRAVQTSRVERTFHDSAAMFEAAFSPDGRRLATINQAGMARLWDAGTGQEVLRLETHTAGNFRELGLAFSPDGTRLASIYANKQVRIWDTETGEALLTLDGHEGPSVGGSGPVLALAFSPDGGRLATGGTDGTARVWDLATGAEVLRIEGPGGSVNTVAFTPDGTRLALGADGDNDAHVWDLAARREVLSLPGPPSAAGGVQTLAVSPDGRRLATGSADTTARVWDLASGRTLAVLYGHTSHVVRVVFDAAGAHLFTASEDGSARMWDVATGQPLLTFAGHGSGVLSVALSPDGSRLATASRDATARIWDTTRLGGGEGPTLVGHTGLVLSVAYSPDGHLLATSGSDQTVRTWDAQTGQNLLTLTGHTSLVVGVAFSPDGARLASAANDGTARIWDAQTGRPEQVLREHSQGDGTVGVAWSPDGQQLVAGGGGGSITVWDAATGRELLNVEHPPGLQAVAFSPDGTQLATAGYDGTTRLWDAATGTPRFVLDSHTRGVNGVAFSPDGRLLATSGNDALVRLWDAQTGRELLTRSGHAGASFGVAFSPDGRHLATSSVDRTVKLWDVVAGRLDPREPLTLAGHTAAVYRLAWSPDGRHLATASRDGTGRVYVIPSEDLVALARTRVTRGLATEECQKYLHATTCTD